MDLYEKTNVTSSNVSNYIEDRRAEPYQDVTSFDDAAGDGADQEDIPAAAGGGVDQEEALAGGGVDQEEALVGGGTDQEDIPARGGADQEDMSVDKEDENEEESEVLSKLLPSQGERDPMVEEESLLMGGGCRMPRTGWRWLWTLITMTRSTSSILCLLRGCPQRGRPTT